jgi:DNA-binding MarR family transcriptional regulator
VPDRLPLSALLSQALVAFTIELDNEFERRMPHRTANHGKSAGDRPTPWLGSFVLWANFLRFVDPAGTPVVEIASNPGVMRQWFAGMNRWGYVIIRPDRRDDRPAPPKRDWIVRLREGGKLAREVWPALPAEIEARWRERFGAGEVTKLRAALIAIAECSEADLPHYMPGHNYVGYLLETTFRRPRPARASPAKLDLAALLSQALMLYTRDYDRQGNTSLLLSANLVRVLGREPIRLRDLPERTGVARVTVDNQSRLLSELGLATVTPDPSAARGQVARLTEKGRRAQSAYARRSEETEAGWHERDGAHDVERLRASLEGLDPALLLDGTRAPAGGWREKTPLVSLPHYPLVTHRGGYPDGS